MGADLGRDKESKRSCNLFCEAVCGRSGVAGALFRRRGRPRAGAGACACKSSYVLLRGESFLPTLTNTGPYFLVFLRSPVVCSPNVFGFSPNVTGARLRFTR